MATVNVICKRAFITKSKSGHYTVTVKEYGTWELDGRTFPYSKVLFREGKIELITAQHLAAVHSA